MALSVRTRFIAISVSITVIALSLFINVIYDKAILYKHSLEKESYRVLADQLMVNAGPEEGLQHVRQFFANTIRVEDQPARLFCLIRNSQREEFLPSATTKLLAKQLIEQIKQHAKGEAVDGVVEHEGQSYFWLKRTLSYKDGQADKLLAVYPLSSAVISDTLNFFGTPLFIASLLLLWAMVWASIILSSLVNKLEKQKQTLSEQADDIVKARDEALEANQAKSIFLANMSHEIRTPLTSIIGFAESCLDSHQTMSERYDATSTIIRSGKHLLHIINEILDVSKIEAGKLDIDIRPVNLVDLLQEVNMYIKVLAEEKGLAFNITNTFPLPRTIVTDPLRLKQILLNLCSNAIKFTEQGYVFLNVAYQPQAESLRLEVVDTGIGMTQQQLDVIFNPFQQADVSTTRKYGGTGLGLTLSKQLAEMLGGELSVESAPEKGSQFTVVIKLEEVDNELVYEADYNQTGADKVTDAPTKLPKISGRILVAEDNLDIQALVKIYLEKIGAEVVLVENGKQAIEAAMSSDFDLVFLDIQMPVMGGMEAVQELRSRQYEKPVLAMTANAMQKDQDACMAAGFDNFVSKPINKQLLYEIILQYIDEVDVSAEDENAMITSGLLQEDPDIIDLVDDFIDRLPVLCGEVNEELQAGNLEEFSSKIHQIKGVGGGYGYPMVTNLCQRIEFQLQANQMQQVAELVKELNQVSERIVKGKEENHRLSELYQSGVDQSDSDHGRARH